MAPGCPNLINYIAKVRVSGSVSLGEVLVPALIEAFVEKNQLSAILRLESEHWFVYLLRVAVTGKSRAEFQFHLSWRGFCKFDCRQGRIYSVDASNAAG